MSAVGTLAQHDLFGNAPAEVEVPRPGSRAARMRQPIAKQLVKDIAVSNDVCIAPMSLRRTDKLTGATDILDVPCGATLEFKCPPCAKRSAKLRRQQIIDGWHRGDEPALQDPMTEDQHMLLISRAHLEWERAALLTVEMGIDDRPPLLAALDRKIADLDEVIASEGVRGRPAERTNPDSDDSEGGEPGQDRKRSTKRRQDVPDLPRRKVTDKTIGQTYMDAQTGKTFRPSMFLTLTLDSYGAVNVDGSPADPDSYDYRRAAWDAIHFPSLLDRFWQNLRRAVGWNVQYAGSIEPQRRLAPHGHFAIRGTIARKLIRQVAAATYHQVWWPPLNLKYAHSDDLRWREGQGFTDPATGKPLLTWEQALDAIDADDDAEPVHVIRFGTQLKAEGVLAGSKDANRCIGYITKYLTKQISDCHEITTDGQRRHHDRLFEELRWTPCSERCPNWLIYGVQPKNARKDARAGHCRAKVHKRETLGMGGRRVLLSRQWSSKTLADHKADNHLWVKKLLGIPTEPEPDNPLPPGQTRYAWERVKPGEPDLTPLNNRLLRRISEKHQWRQAIDEALARQRQQNISATDHNGPGDDR